MSALTATVEGIGFWTRGLPSWDAACAFANGGALVDGAPARPSPELLPANERRRAPETVAVALQVAQAACAAAGRDPATLPSVFASGHGDFAITDYVCTTLADDARAMSPTKFHNSVHNAAAGYWTIGTGCMQAATAIAAFDGSFAQGLVEAMAQLHEGADAVLLVGYDAAAVGGLASVADSTGLLGGALVLSRAPRPDAPTLTLAFEDGDGDADGALLRHGRGNAMASMLPLFDALATGAGEARLRAGPGRALRLQIVHAAAAKVAAHA